MKRKGDKALARAKASVEAAGWAVADTGRRLVASKRVIEEDHSVTNLYESSYDIEHLAALVRRRETELAR